MIVENLALLRYHSILGFTKSYLRTGEEQNIGCLGSAIEEIKSGQNFSDLPDHFQKPTAAIFECQGLARSMMCNKICFLLIGLVVVRCCES